MLVFETEAERGCSDILFANGVVDEDGFGLKEGGATVDTAGGGWLSGFTDADRDGLLPMKGLGLLDGGGGAGPLQIDGFFASIFGGGPLPILPSFFSNSIIKLNYA